MGQAGVPEDPTVTTCPNTTVDRNQCCDNLFRAVLNLIILFFNISVILHLPPCDDDVDEDPEVSSSFFGGSSGNTGEGDRDNLLEMLVLDDLAWLGQRSPENMTFPKTYSNL